MRDKIFHLINKERLAQDEKWGVEDHPDLRWLGILMEEVGEAAKDIIENNHPKDLTKEIIQIATVCVAWLEISKVKYLKELHHGEKEKDTFGSGEVLPVEGASVRTEGSSNNK